MQALRRGRSGASDRAKDIGVKTMSGGMRMIGQVLGWSTGVAMLRALIEPERGHWAAVVIFLIAGFVWVTTVPTKPG